MKFPAVWIATAVAAGIEMAIRWQQPVAIWAAAAGLAMLAASIALRLRRTHSALLFSLAAWLAVGGVAVSVEKASVPVNHVARLLAAGSIDVSQPLRWQGHLRENPQTLPWGTRYEIALDGVESGGAKIAVTGGLRANLYSDSRGVDAPAGHYQAGDRVEVLLRAEAPRNFLDPGAFDTREYLASQGIDLVGSLRSGELMRLIPGGQPTMGQLMARARGKLLSRLDTLFGRDTERAAVLRAMLLGDRSFVDSSTVTAFQKTSAYHVLVVAGLHVGAIVVFFFWICRKVRLAMGATTLVTLAALAGYVSVVQDRPPILRAALMAAFYLGARPLFRRVQLLNTVALAALVLLFWKPSAEVDSSFQLSFMAAGVIAALALPWIQRTSEPYLRGLRHLGDVTRDGGHAPNIAQFRIEMRLAAKWLEQKVPAWLGRRTSIVLVAPMRLGLRLWEIALLSFAIQLGMLPLLAADFHRISMAGPLSNIPAVMLTGIIVPLGFLALLMTFVSARMAVLLAKMTSLTAGLLLDIVRWFAARVQLSFRIPGPPTWLSVLFFLVLMTLAVSAHRALRESTKHAVRRKSSQALRMGEWLAWGALAVLTVLLCTHPFKPQLAKGALEINILDVGQGDAIFAAFPDGRTMLIDGGGLEGSGRVGGYRTGMDVGEDVVSPYLWSRGIKRIDVVGLTHAHHDHLDGLHSVIENFRVKELWIGRDEETPAFRSLLQEARTHGVILVHQQQGKAFDWDGVRGEVLWPPDAGPEKEASNDDSLVLRLIDGANSFLLPGDIEQRVENRLVAEHAPLASDFLKIPHHGSKTSSTQQFLSAVAPRLAVVSAGAGNPFGHPAPVIVARYASAGVQFLRTDRDGAVTVLTDGKSLFVKTYANTLRTGGRDAMASVAGGISSTTP